MTDGKKQKSNATEPSSDIRQLVAFQVGKEIFSVDISKVREINRLVEITSIPESPAFIEGVINLRGEIIPIIDMRKRFRLQTGSGHDKDTRIMVIETEGRMIGFIVDAVKEVLRIAGSSIEVTPDLVTDQIDRRYIEGVATVDDRLLIVLDSDLIFAKSELKKIEKLDRTAAA